MPADLANKFLQEILVAASGALGTLLVMIWRSKADKSVVKDLSDRVGRMGTELTSGDVMVAAAFKTALDYHKERVDQTLDEINKRLGDQDKVLDEVRVDIKTILRNGRRD